MRCYEPEPTNHSGTVLVDLEVPGACWQRTSHLGRPLGTVCADAAGRLELAIGEAPTYLSGRQ